MSQQNPYLSGPHGLFRALEGETAKSHRGAVIVAGGQAFDANPYFRAVLDIGNVVQQFGHNPYSPLPLLQLQKMSKQLHPALKASLASPALAPHVAPMAQGLSTFMQNSNKLIQMRLKTSHHIARAPKILVPISMSIAAGGTLTAVQVRNPYLGASGGAVDTYQAPWTITSFRTSNGESGALLPIRITQFLIGGHDFVAAALSGLTYTAGGAPATQGWAAGAFAETKRSNWRTEVQPWNVVAVNGGGTGFGSIMTETGFLQIGVFNGGSQTYVDTYSVYCNATLCGSPFGIAQWTQVDAFRKAFMPLNLQTQTAMRLAGDSDRWTAKAIEPDAQGVESDPYLSPYAMIDRLASLAGSFDSFLNAPPAGVAMGDQFYDPRDLGMQLPDGASYVG